MKLLVIILMLGLIGCQSKQDKKLKIKQAYIEKIKDSEKSNDHELILCFDKKLTSYHYDISKSGKSTYKIEVQIYSKLGWSQTINQGIQRAKVMDERPNCMKVINESFYHPFMGYDPVVDDNFSKDNIRVIIVKLLHFEDVENAYIEMDHFEYKESY